MKAYLIILQAIYVLCLIPWFVFWGLSFMSFDMGFSWANITFVGTITLYPVAVIACSIVAWLIHKRKKRTAIILNLVPSLWILGFLSFMLFV
ncbi:hypothetical protein [Paenibacillus soyae]|uniref:Uncharacterized protein n=1 Tax=Paenibacillus soyae TaxID=2969249 RepID=A0A9X2SA03_9BACL|nr:hypothetical protein [Paenibacillus soyae]MCR2804098.1 hypothetical protein [Paenibacillus soyae]